jgi:hypothetical protein
LNAQHNVIDVVIFPRIEPNRRVPILIQNVLQNMKVVLPPHRPSRAANGGVVSLVIKVARQRLLRGTPVHICDFIHAVQGSSRALSFATG